MTTESITTIKLTAAEGMMLTDGEHFGKEVFLAIGADQSAWYEITEAEYDEIMAKESQQGEPESADSI